MDTDKKDRPLQDIRIVNCGELIRKAKKITKKKEKSSASEAGEASSADSSSSSESSSNSSEEEKKKKKKKNKKEKKKKSKKEKKKRKHKESSIEDDSQKLGDHPLATLTNIDPDEIPDVPSNRYMNFQFSIFIYYTVTTKVRPMRSM